MRKYSFENLETRKLSKKTMKHSTGGVFAISLVLTLAGVAAVGIGGAIVATK